MATTSILKNVTIKEKKLGRNFVTALERASTQRSKEVIFSRVCRDVKGDDIKKFFGDRN